jgi:hypothetical protein
MFHLALSTLRPGRVGGELAERDASRRRRRNRLAPGAEALEVRDCPSGAAAHLAVSETAHAMVAARHAAVRHHHQVVAAHHARQKAASTIYVSPKGKSGLAAGKNAAHPASLKVALKRAKAGSTIVLAPGVYTQAVGLMGKSDITIRGAADGATILAGSGNYTLKIYSSSGITIDHVTFRSPNGNGVAVYGSSVTLSNVSAVGNHVDGVVVAGGGSVNVTSSHFDSSQTGDGMDVQSGTATITASTFNNNGTAGGAMPGGSGLSVEANSQVTITNSQLNGNLNSNMVGYDQAQVTAQGSTFNNSQKGNGAIFSGQASVNLTGNTFASNGKVFGATTGFNGIEFHSGFTGGATVSGNTFTGNTESGVFISGSSSAIQVTGNRFIDNFVGLNMDASTSAVNAVVQGNTFMVTSGSSFQGLDAAGSNVTATVGGTGSQQNVFENYANNFSILEFHASAGKTIGCPNVSLQGNSYLQNGNAISQTQAISPC